MISGTRTVLRILRRVSAVLAAAGTVNTFARCIGHKRVAGQYTFTTGTVMDAGFPRVRFSNNGTTFQVVRLISIDAAASAAAGVDVYAFDMPVEGAYVAIEVTSTPGAAAVAAWAELRPE